MMKNKITTSVTLLLMSFALITTTATAQDFAGSWTLDADASDTPQNQFQSHWTSLDIEESDSELVITRERPAQQGPMQGEMTITINLEGETVENPFFGDNTTQTSAEWEDGALVVTNEASITGQMGEAMEFTTTEKLSLSEDGNVLTVSTITPGFGGGGGETTLNSVYNRDM